MAKKLLVAAAVALLLPAAADAEQGIYRDRFGGYRGSWEGNDVERTYKDQDGSYAGSAERFNGGWVFKDRFGSYSGSSTGPSDRNFNDDED